MKNKNSPRLFIVIIIYILITSCNYNSNIEIKPAEFELYYLDLDTMDLKEGYRSHSNSDSLSFTFENGFQKTDILIRIYNISNLLMFEKDINISTDPALGMGGGFNIKYNNEFWKLVVIIEDKIYAAVIKEEYKEIALGYIIKFYNIEEKKYKRIFQIRMSNVGYTYM